uniref:AgmX/PglI C-terminal domain-containing protein n=1 Tax=Desulfobacca acetoxidans TaxID=60893 RepID=A0A7V6DQE8_9BACT
MSALMKRGRQANISAARSCFWLARLAVMLGCLMVLAFRPVTFQNGPAGEAEKDKTLSPYFVVLGNGADTEALPLKSTRADVKIAGKVADVTVTQVYKNQGKKALEAVYVFPGSTRAAVHALRMTVGERVIEAQVMERQKARQTYEDAKKEGKTASLLEQQRPNVFQMNVANILPGDEIKVELKYLELLRAEDKVYEFVYPAVVGPRYSNMPKDGAPDTEKWVENPYLHQGENPPYTFGITVEVRGGLPLAKLASPSHEVNIKYSNPQVAQVTLKDDKTGGNRDFVLRYALAGNKVDTGLLLYPGKDENFFLMVMEPPERVKQEAVVPREYIFIVDVSGSMHGYPLETSKALMRNIIQKLRPQDAVNVLLFESNSAVLSESGSLPATEANKQRALDFIQAQPGSGGTEILPAFQRALALPRTKGASRVVVVATDGYVNVEARLFDLIRQNLGDANLFPFGIGTSVNRFLIDGMARAGKGEPFVILNQSEAPKQAARFQRYIETPVLTGIKVAFSGFDAYDVEPRALPDLFAERPLTLLGKYRGTPQGAVVVTGRTARGDFRQELKVEPGQASPENEALKFLWARQRIQHLADDLHFARTEDEAKVKEITALGLKYNLMTAYTSFVAVDQVKRGDGTMTTVKQPLPLPAGVSDLAVGSGVAYSAGFQGKSRYIEAFGSMPGPSGKMAALPAQPVPSTGGEQKPAQSAISGLTVKVLQVQGKLAPALLQQALQAELSRFEKCYQEAQARGENLPGTMVLHVTIGPDGKVIKVRQGSKVMAPATLAECLLTAVKEIAFPKPPSGQVEVRVQFKLAG